MASNRLTDTRTILTVNQLAEQLGVRPSTVYYHLRLGHVEAHYLGNKAFFYEYEVPKIKADLAPPSGLGVSQVCRILDVAPPTVYSLLATGKIKAKKVKGVHRFDEESVIAYDLQRRDRRQNELSAT